MDDTTQTEDKAGANSYINLKFKKPKPFTTLVIVVVITIVIILLFFKGLFFAANVNGMLISRHAVIKELENQGGRQVLDEMIRNKLIESNINKEEITISKESIDIELENIKTEITNQGGTFEAFLEEQRVTEKEFRKQVIRQKKLEEILVDKISITDEEISAYLADTQTIKPEGLNTEDFREQIKTGLGQQKFQQASQEWLGSIQANAKIKYYVNY